jgi:hypothetical protein
LEKHKEVGNVAFGCCGSIYIRVDQLEIYPDMAIEGVLNPGKSLFNVTIITSWGHYDPMIAEKP